MSTINNLDEKHNDMLQQFHIDVTEKVPNLQLERKELEHQLEKLTSNQIDQKLDIQDKITQITKEIKVLKRKKKKLQMRRSKTLTAININSRKFKEMRRKEFFGLDIDTFVCFAYCLCNCGKNSYIVLSTYYIGGCVRVELGVGRVLQ